MFSIKAVQAAMVEVTRVLGYSELRSNQERVVAQFMSGKLEAADSPFRTVAESAAIIANPGKAYVYA